MVCDINEILNSTTYITSIIMTIIITVLYIYSKNIYDYIFRKKKYK